MDELVILSGSIMYDPVPKIRYKRVDFLSFQLYVNYIHNRKKEAIPGTIITIWVKYPLSKELYASIFSGDKVKVEGTLDKIPVINNGITRNREILHLKKLTIDKFA